MSIMLNEICINEEILPIYIYIFNLHVHDDTIRYPRLFLIIINSTKITLSNDCTLIIV